MLSEFLIELKLSEEQEKTAQIVTGPGSSTHVKPSACTEYVNASNGKVQPKGKGKGGDGKNGKQNWRQGCSDYWRPDGCQLDITAQKETIPVDKQADAQFAVRSREHPASQRCRSCQRCS